MYACTSVGAWVGQRYRIPLELELKVLGNLGRRMLGIELRSSAGSIRTRCRAIFPALTHFQPQQLVRTPKCCLYHEEAPQSEQRKLPKFSSLQIWEVTRKVSAGLPSSEDLYPWLKMPSSSWVFLRSLPVCLLPAGLFVQRCQPFWTRTLLLISLYFNYVFKHPVINTVTLRGTKNQNNVN